MCLVLFLLWCSAIVGRCGGPNVLCYNSHNSRFGAFNSRLSRPKFPVQTTTGICPQEIDLAHRFRGETAIAGGKSTKFPILAGKKGVLFPLLAKNVCCWNILARKKTKTSTPS